MSRTTAEKPAERARLVPERRDRDRHVHLLPVAAAPPGVAGDVAVALGGLLEELLERGRGMLGDEARDVRPCDLFERVAEQPLGGGIPARDAALEGGGDDGVERRSHDGGELGLRGSGGPLLGDVAHRRDDELIPCARDRGEADVDGELRAVLAAAAQREPSTHEPALRRRGEPLPVPSVAPADPLGYQGLDRLPRERSRQVAEERLCLLVGRDDGAVRVDRHGRVGHERQERAEQLAGDRPLDTARTRPGYVGKAWSAEVGHGRPGPGAVLAPGPLPPTLGDGPSRVNATACLCPPPLGHAARTRWRRPATVSTEAMDRREGRGP